MTLSCAGVGACGGRVDDETRKKNEKKRKEKKIKREKKIGHIWI